MDLNKIDALLERYWAGETSLEEEEQLRDYFRRDGVPETYRETANLFRYFDTQKKKSVDDAGFDAAVLAKTGVPKRGKMIKLFSNSMRIAAGVAVLMLAVWFVRREVRETTPPEIVDTYDDPKLALEETKKALLMISKSFGRAEQETKKINLLNEAKEEIGKQKM
jgi:hypothetical protein